MDFSQIESQTFLNIHLFINNYLGQSFKIGGSYSDYRNFSKNSNRHKIAIRESILTEMI